MKDVSPDKLMLRFAHHVILKSFAIKFTDAIANVQTAFVSILQQVYIEPKGWSPPDICMDRIELNVGEGFTSAWE
jgi:hypothetical protein